MYVLCCIWISKSVPKSETCHNNLPADLPLPELCCKQGLWYSICNLLLINEMEEGNLVKIYLKEINSRRLGLVAWVYL